MDGVRVLEVAQFTFVPAAGAVLADWGADVIKVEHAETGDAQRGLSALMDMPVGGGSFAPLMEHPNRGKRSIGLALEQPGADRPQDQWRGDLSKAAAAVRSPCAGWPPSKTPTGDRHWSTLHRTTPRSARSPAAVPEAARPGWPTGRRPGAV